jgi:hypothetical protein
LVVETARRDVDYVGGTLVIPQTVLVREYWEQIRAGFAAADILMRHIALHAEVDTLIGRIERDTAANRQWRLDHLAQYQQGTGLARGRGRDAGHHGSSPARHRRNGYLGAAAERGGVETGLVGVLVDVVDRRVVQVAVGVRLVVMGVFVAVLDVLVVVLDVCVGVFGVAVRVFVGVRRRAHSNCLSSCR